MNMNSIDTKFLTSIGDRLETEASDAHSQIAECRANCNACEKMKLSIAIENYVMFVEGSKPGALD